ncbi:LppP/LprE lipoprotein [Actinocrispum wychmicini]|uniref:LppP/LprE lipoprotein n=1 Tax=Actinocrispum wychmicini TaxID=1213861 RepID=A0A4R2JQB8_9PSEU|nr:LppP/LprE lipoprotein [Actinocrispum wychmicini]
MVAMCCLALSACATTGGVEIAGPAAQVTPPPSTQPPPSNVTPSVDPVAVLRTDPKVSDKIKTLLTPCVGDRYPVDARYADVTGDGSPELIATIASCDTKLPGSDYRDNLAIYVYDLKPTPPAQLLAVEQPSADIYVEDSALTVVYVRWQARDKSCCPSGVTTVPYRWTGAALEPVKK